MCLSVLVCDYECIRFRLCCFVYLCAEFRHTLTHWIMMCVCLVHSMSGLCPLGRPCVARFCGNRFWQLCNFCWFIPDLGKLFFCSAGVVCKAHTHTHTQKYKYKYILYIHLHTRVKQEKQKWQLNYAPTTHIYTHQLTFIHSPPTPFINTNSCTHLVLVGLHSTTSQWHFLFQFCSSHVDWLTGWMGHWSDGTPAL